MAQSAPPGAPPPPPPQPVRKKPSAVAYVGAIGLLLIIALPQLVIDSGTEGLAFRIGRLLGNLFFSLLLAKFIWWLVRRSRKDLSPWSPWVFVIAAGVSLFGLIGALSS